MNRSLLFVFACGLAGCARPPVPFAGEVDRLAAAVRLPAVPAAFVGEGSLEAHGDKTERTRLAIEKLAIAAKTTGDVADTTVEHVFRNDTDERLEGTFRFPLPADAIVTGLALEIDGKLAEGEFVERDKARKTYEQVVDQMLDPALLEWESGQTFKLAVFPIEPHANKRVVLHFLAPLYRGQGGLFFAVRPPAPGAAVPIEKLRIDVDGRSVDPGRATHAPSGELLVHVADSAPDAVEETRPEGKYVHVRLDPVPADAPVPSAGPKAMILLCDRSRSMLEAGPLEVQLASMLLGQLGEGDEFGVFAGDVGVRSLAGGLRSAREADEREALSRLGESEPDGASDLGAILAASAAAVRDARAAHLQPVVVYLGDATPTWGETQASRLERVAADALAGAPLHVVLMGKSTDDATARALAEAGHGRLLRPKTEADAHRAAALVASAATARRIDDVHLVGADALDVPLAPPPTVYEGDEIGLSLFIPSGADATGLRIAGTVGRRPFARPIDLAGAVAAPHVAQRWATAKIEALQRDGEATKDRVVATSLEHGVMSRYTSLLVLESEEAYERMHIARRAKSSSPSEPSVSGQDLDGAGGAPASVSPDHIQPGDPEVRVDAPSDAQSVVVVFPFGDTKVASFEPDERGGAWVVRFLVDRRTPDGTYEIAVRITHRDGRVEIVKVPYVVDTQRPHLRVAVTPKSGAYEIRATQELTPEEIAAQAPSARGTLEERRRSFARVLTDAKRVEVRTPDGQVLSLTHVTLGEFLGVWRPHAPLLPSDRLRVVAVDRALNESATEVELP
ncbi:MAG TPA: VIT and VWA domain-containing protein [Polyangiaceae bacterium]|nr:VIT and VWA domain-containing protein [Polyangiaceae bacterium]